MLSTEFTPPPPYIPYPEGISSSSLNVTLYSDHYHVKVAVDFLLSIMSQPFT